MADNIKIDRREAVKKASLFLGFAVSGPALTGVLNGCTPKQNLHWQPVFLTEEEAQLVESVSARILPSGESPGAADAGVGGFIDQMVGEYYLPEDQLRFRNGLKDLENLSEEVLSKSFLKADNMEQDQVLTAMVEAARSQTSRDHHFFLMIKELTVLGFFTSEIGATQFLNYDEIPGGYQGCQSLESLGGKTWAT